MNPTWLAARMQYGEPVHQGYSRIFELSKALKNPINLHVGQPHFDVPDPIKDAAIAAIRQGHNAYTVAAGIAQLRDMIRADVKKQYGHADRDVIIAGGTLGALTLAVLCTVN